MTSERNPSRPGNGISVLLVADPGLPTRRARAIQGRLEKLLDRTYSPPVQLWTRTQFLRTRPDDTLDLGSASRLREEYDHVDVVVLLTEIPRFTNKRPLVAEVYPGQQVGVVSCPTLGVLTTKRRIVSVLMDCIARLVGPTDGPGEEPAALRWSRWERDDEESQTRYLLRTDTLLGTPRTVIGMAMANDPWRTAPRLSSAVAAASATGAFGIFYSSIWKMASYLSPARFLLVALLAVAVMVTWLIVSNRLWDSPIRRSLAAVVLLYNLSTVITLLICVTVLYLGLVLLIFLGGLVVIDPDFLEEVVGQSVGVTSYLDIAWFSAAMGVVAGGLGASFDSDTDLRQLTHGQRERQRHYTEDDDPAE